MKPAFLLSLFLLGTLLSGAQETLPGQTRPYLPFTDTLLPAGFFSSPAKTRFYLDSVIYYDYLAGTSDWAAAGKYAYTYREDGLRKDQTYFMRSGNTWVPAEKNLYEYSDGQISRVELLGYAGEYWHSLRQVLYYRDENGLLTEQLTQNWDPGTAVWINLYRYLFGYDEWHQVVSRTYQQYTDSLWVNNHRYEWTLVSGRTTEMLRRNWSTADSAYYDAYRFVYQYNDLGAVTEEIQYNADGEGQWVPASRIVYQYDLWGEVVRKLYENYETSSATWKPVVDYLYEQDKQQRDTLILYRIYSPVAGVWNEDYRYLFNYDSYGNLAGETWQEWKGAWVNDLKIEYFVRVGEQGLRVEITDSSMVSCFGYADGSATAEASGGSTPYAFLWDDDHATTTSFVSGLAGGRWYHVRVTDAALNTASDSIYISEPPPVLTGPIKGPPLVKPGEMVIYFVQAEPGAWYTWEVQGGKFLSGQGGPEIEVLWMKPGTGQVSVSKTGPSGCPGDTSYLNVQIGVVPGVPEIISTGIKLYPNPGSSGDLVTVEFAKEFSGAWSLSDVSGRLLITGQTASVIRLEIVLPRLRPGIYFWNFNGKRHYRMKWAAE